MKKNLTCPFLLLFILIFFNFCNKVTDNNKSILKDQSFLALKEKFDSQKYEDVLKALSLGLNSFETNSIESVLAIKKVSIDRIVKQLNLSMPRSNASEYIKDRLKVLKQYGIIFNGSSFVSSGLEYEEIFSFFEKKNRLIPLKYIEDYLNSVSDNSQSEYLKRVEKVLSLFEKNRVDRTKCNDFLVSIMKRLAFISGFIPANKVDLSFSSLLIRSIQQVKQFCGEKEKTVADFLELAILTEKGDRKKIQEKKNYLMEKNLSNPLVSFVYYWKGAEEYKKNNKSKAISLYRKSYNSALSLTDSDIENYFIRDFSSAEHFRQDIINRIKVLQSEITWENIINNPSSKIAVVTGDYVRLRKTMSSSSPENVITSLATGQKVLILKRSDSPSVVESYKDYWYYVKVPGNLEGWVFGKYLLLF